MAYWFCDDSVFGVGGFLCDFCVKFDDFIQKKKINLIQKSGFYLVFYIVVLIKSSYDQVFGI